MPTSDQEDTGSIPAGSGGRVRSLPGQQYSFEGIDYATLSTVILSRLVSGERMCTSTR